jgi:hypothetical protein
VFDVESEGQWKAEILAVMTSLIVGGAVVLPPGFHFQSISSAIAASSM